MKALSFAEAAQFEPGKKFIQSTKRMVKASFNRWAAERGIPNDDLRTTTNNQVRAAMMRRARRLKRLEAGLDDDLIEEI